MRLYCVPLLFAAVLPVAHAEEDAALLLQRVVSTYTQAKRYHFESISDAYTTGQMDQSWSRSSVVLAVDNLERVRFTTKSMSGSMSVVSDGKVIWIASADTREYMRTEFPGSILNVKGGGPLAEMSMSALKQEMNFFSRFSRNLKKAHATGRQVVEVTGEDIECIVVLAEYDPPTGMQGVESIMRTLWVDPKRLIVLREETVTRGKLIPSLPHYDVEQRFSRRFTFALIGEEPPASLFSFEPPKQYREVDRLERAFPRLSTELKGKPAPELTLRDLSGGDFKLSDYKGRIVLLDFWATWCAPCRSQMISLAKLNEAVRDQGVVLVGVNDDENPEVASAYLKEKGYAWRNVLDTTKKEARAKYKVGGIPTTVVIDRDGLVVEYQAGAGEASEAAIRTALTKLGVRLP